MPVFSVTVDTAGVVYNIRKAQSAAVQLGNSFGEMKNKGQAGADAVAASMENLAKKALAAFSIYKGFDISRNAVLAAGKYEMLGAVTMNVADKAGYLRKEVNETVRALERQGIAMMESTNLVSQMMRAQMSLSDAEKLAGVARDSAAIGLMNTTQSFETMIHGIQTAQTEVLRTIGINVNFEQSYKKYATAIGKSVSAMSEQEKMQARINAVKEAGINIEGSYEAALELSYKKMTSIPRYLDNIQIYAGKLGEGVFSEFITGAYDAAKATEGWLRKMDEAGKLEGFSKGLAGGFKEVTAHADTLAVALGAVAAVRIAQSIRMPALVAGELAYQRALLGTAAASRTSMAAAVTLGTARNAASGLIGMLGGPWGAAITAASVGLYAFSSRQSEGERVAKQYGFTLESLMDKYKDLGSALGEAAIKTDGLTAAQQRARLEAQRGAVDAAEKKLADAKAGITKTLSFNTEGTTLTPDFGGIEHTFQRFSALDESYVKQARAQLELIKNGALETREGAASVGVTLQGLVDELDKIGAESSFSRKSIEARALAEELRPALGQIGAIQKAIEDLPPMKRILVQLIMGSQVLPDSQGTSKEAADIYTANYKSVTETYNKTATAQKSARIAELTKQIEILKGMKKTFTKDGPDGKNIADYTRMLTGLEAELSSVNGEAKKSASVFKEKESAIRSLEDETNRLIMSERQYAEWQIKMKASEWRSKGLPEDKVKAFEDAGIAGLNKKKFDETRKYLTEFEQHYQQVMGRVRDTEKSIASEMEQYRIAAMKMYADQKITLKEYEELLRRIDEMERKKKENASREWDVGVKRGLQSVYDEATDLGKLYENFTVNTFSTLENAIVDSAFGAKDAWENAGKSILKMLAQILVKQAIIAPLTQFIGSVTGMPVSTAHNGGVAGIAMTGTTFVDPRVFSDAPRYHTGGVAGGGSGIGAGEYPAVLRYGEPIFTPEQAATLAPLSTIQAMLERTGGPAAVGGNITVVQSFAVTVQSDGKDGQQIGQDVSNELMKTMGQGMRNIVRDELMQQTRPGGMLNPRGGYG